MTFTGEIDGYAVTVTHWESHVEFRCNDLGGCKSFKTAQALTAAVKAYDLTLRKSFSNPQAWLAFRSTIEEVEVTSLDDTQCWIKRAGKREKCERRSLFVDRDAVDAVIEREKANAEDMKLRWAALKRWEPKP